MNSTNLTFLNYLKVRLVLVLALAVAAMIPGQTALAAKGTPFSRIIVLGDSLSDTGNFFKLSGGFPPAPYFGGRFSNGQLWVEYLASSLGMRIASEDNYAVGGATTGSFNGLNGIAGLTYPGLQQQVTALLSDHPQGLDPNALYTLWIGANDLFVAVEMGSDPVAMIGPAVTNIVQTIQMLAGAGARYIIVPNMADLGVTPLALASGVAPIFTELSIAYNKALAGALRTLADSGIDTIEVDAFATVQMVVKHPALFGFRNVTDSYLPAMQGDARRFFFWDDVHPTTHGHAIVGSVALLEMIEHFTRQTRSPRGANSNVMQEMLRLKSRQFKGTSRAERY